MEIERKSRNPHRARVTMDLIHVIVGAAIVILAILGFVDPMKNQKLFALVFAFASLLNFINGVPRLQWKRGSIGQFFFGIFLCLIGIVLLGLAMVSIIAFW